MFPRLFIAALGTVAATTVAAASPAPAPPGNSEKGRAIFARCAVCHKVDAAVPGGIGPNLSGVYGRPAARVEGYTYSPALKASRLKWDGATLSRFLAAPCASSKCAKFAHIITSTAVTANINSRSPLPTSRIA